MFLPGVIVARAATAVDVRVGGGKASMITLWHSTPYTPTLKGAIFTT